MKEISFKNDILPLGDLLFRLALRIVGGNRPEAEDIVQDTLIRLWENKEQLADINNIQSYAMTICRNLALDHKEKFENQNISLCETDHDRADDHDSPDKALIKKQQYETAEQIINQLPEKQRTLVQLRDIEGKNYQEMADITGLTLADVKVTLFRARQTLKEKLSRLAQ
ncbi:MAG: RNA polymerase sigma factor [Prevotellaceae bacterium]|nr:RNA polymerase sigma factor [Candidatus Colivivens caballi]